jgi:hypothetical protein
MCPISEEPVPRSPDLVVTSVSRPVPGDAMEPFLAARDASSLGAI